MKSRNLIFLLSFGLAATVFFSCNGNDITDPPGPYKLSYGDSILYMRSSGDNIVYPASHRDGRYTGFPDGIEIDEASGAINLANSETGLRYKITHTAPDGTKTEIKVVLSGITFTDKF